MRFDYVTLLRVDEPEISQTTTSVDDPATALRPSSDAKSLVLLLHRMSSGCQDVPDSNPDALLAAVHDPLKRSLISSSLLEAKTPSADELVQLIMKLSPIDIADAATMAERQLLLEVAKRVKAAEDESKQKFDELFDEMMPFGGEAMLTRAASVAGKYTETPTQPCDEGVSLERVHANAVRWCPGMINAMRAFVEQAGGKLMLPPHTELKLNDPTLSIDQCVKTVKAVERAQEKVDGDYDGDARRLVDLVRASAIFEKPTELEAALELLESMMATGNDGSSSCLRLVRAKDRLNNPVAGYRDMMLNLAFDVGGECVHVGELQLHLRTVLAHKEVAHVSYGIGRGIF